MKKLSEVILEYVYHVLKHTNFNRTATAEILDVNRMTVVHKIRELRELGFVIGKGVNRTRKNKDK